MAETPIGGSRMSELPERMVVDVDDTLNFRTRPEVRPGTRIAELSDGRVVEPVERSVLGEEHDWIVATTEVEGRPTTGYLAAEYLERARVPERDEAAEGAIPPALLTNVRADPGRGGRYPYSIPRDAAPTRVRDASDAEQARQLIAIVDWLDVEESARYEPESDATYCNIYAHDYCHLASTYLPRVWWKAHAITKWRDGNGVDEEYAETVHEYNANMLFDWLEKWGESFGWQRLRHPATAQQRVNDGAVGVIVGQRVDRSYSGHVTVIVPELDRDAERTGGEVTAPLQSQAGANNHRYHTDAWWDAPRYAAHGFWVHG